IVRHSLAAPDGRPQCHARPVACKLAQPRQETRWVTKPPDALPRFEVHVLCNVLTHRNIANRCQRYGAHHALRLLNEALEGGRITIRCGGDYWSQCQGPGVAHRAPAEPRTPAARASSQANSARASTPTSGLGLTSARANRAGTVGGVVQKAEIVDMLGSRFRFSLSLQSQLPVAGTGDRKICRVCEHRHIPFAASRTTEGVKV